MPKIGVLALQGAFFEHEKMLSSLGAKVFEIRQRRDFDEAFDGLILPGGESTVMGKLLRESGLFDPILKAIHGGLPVFGTCAGLLLLAKEIENDARRHFATMDIAARRNAYGRQIDSFACVEEFKGLGKIPMTFIRAPYITKAGKDVEILAVKDEKIVAARQGNQLVTAFHPELDNCLLVHEYFLKTIVGNRHA